MTNIHQLLKQYWGYDNFRPLQEEIIESVLAKKDTLALLPTGGGKSICFQVPALASDGFCLVISPLIALMKDQVQHLKNKKIKAEAIYTGIPKSDIDRIINNALFDPDFKFLYVSPERLKTDTFKCNMRKMKLNLIAVDEAHCISQWGYDFRPPYLEIAEIRSFFPKTPILALTATATPVVVNDIQEKLLFKQKNLFQKSFRRENLTYFVVKEDDKMQRMLRIMSRYKGTSIVYVRNRKKTVETAEFLNKNGIRAEAYHAGLDLKLREERQKAWMNNKIRVITATNAFGMGIDKPEVRLVLHLDIPDTLEAYFQEAGRGGRDEKEAVAILLYDDGDLKMLKKNFEQSFPDINTVRQIYETIMQQYRVPLYSGNQETLTIDFDVIASNCNLPKIVIFNALSFLEKDGLITFNEELRTSSSIIVKINSREIENLYNNFPQEKNFFKILLRTYGGLFSNYVNINEKTIADIAELSENEVVDKLQNLKNWNVIDYKKINQKPQIVLLQDRILSENLTVSKNVYNKRKSTALNNLKAVIAYVKTDYICRSRQLLNYFGESRTLSCHKCDVCLKLEKEKLGHDEFYSMNQELDKLLLKKQVNEKDIFLSLSEKFPEKKVLTFIRWLKDKGKLKTKD